MDTKTCTKCNQQKNIADFPARKQQGRVGAHSWCQPCYTSYKKDYWERNKESLAAKRKVYYEKNREKCLAQCKARYEKSDKEYRRDQSWENKLKSKFGMTVLDYEALLESQGGVCAICKQPETMKMCDRTIRLAVDHCHDSNVVRGLLCHDCNTAIGLLDHSIERMNQAIEYLASSTANIDQKVLADFPGGTI